MLRAAFITVIALPCRFATEWAALWLCVAEGHVVEEQLPCPPLTQSFHCVHQHAPFTGDDRRKPVGKKRIPHLSAAKRVPESPAAQSSAAAAGRHRGFDACFTDKLAGQVIRLTAFNSTRVLVPRVGCIAAVTCYFF